MDRFGSDWESILLIRGNLTPLIYVLFLGGDLWFLLILYWLENFIAGGFNVLMMLTSTGRGLLARLATAGFFAVHYTRALSNGCMPCTRFKTSAPLQGVAWMSVCIV
jgi:hypothetical protein